MSIQRALDDAADRIADCYDSVETMGGHAVAPIAYYAWSSAPPDIFYTVNYPPVIGETAYLNAYHRWETSSGTPYWVYTLKAIPEVGDTIYTESGGVYTGVSAVTSITQIGPDFYDITAVDSTYDAERLGNDYGWVLGEDYGFKVQGYYPSQSYEDIMIELNGQTITGGSRDSAYDLRSTGSSETLTNLATAIQTIPQTVNPPLALHGATIDDMMPDFGTYGAKARTTGNHDVVISDATSWSASIPLQNKFSYGGIKSFTLNNVTTTGAANMIAMTFRNCTNLTSVNLSALTTANGNNAFNNMCYGCTSLTSFSAPSLTSATGTNAFYQAFRNCTKLTSINLSNLTTATGGSCFLEAFAGCTKLESIDLSKLADDASITNSGWMSSAFKSSGLKTFTCNVKSTNTSAFNSAFESCTSLTSVSFPKLTTVTGQSCQKMFYGCTNLETVSFPALTTIETSTAISGTFSNAFVNCKKLTTISFPELTRIGYSTSSNGTFMTAFYATSSTNTYQVSVYFPKVTTIYNNNTSSSATFNGCNRLSKIYFKSLTSIQGTGANYIFRGCSQLSEIHFGSDNQATIEAMSGYATLWGRGAGAATVYFDL